MLKRAVFFWQRMSFVLRSFWCFFFFWGSCTLFALAPFQENFGKKSDDFKKTLETVREEEEKASVPVKTLTDDFKNSLNTKLDQYKKGFFSYIKSRLFEKDFSFDTEIVAKTTAEIGEATQICLDFWDKSVHVLGFFQKFFFKRFFKKWLREFGKNGDVTKIREFFLRRRGWGRNGFLSGEKPWTFREFWILKPLFKELSDDDQRSIVEKYGNIFLREAYTENGNILDVFASSYFMGDRFKEDLLFSEVQRGNVERIREILRYSFQLRGSFDILYEGLLKNPNVSIPFAQLLLDSEIWNMNATDSDGKTILKCAVERNNKSIVKLLLSWHERHSVPIVFDQKSSVPSLLSLAIDKGASMLSLVMDNKVEKIEKDTEEDLNDGKSSFLKNARKQFYGDRSLGKEMPVCVQTLPLDSGKASFKMNVCVNESAIPVSELSQKFIQTSREDLFF